MKSLKNRFIKTTLFMAILSTAFVLLVTVLLLLLFSVLEPNGFQRVCANVFSIYAGICQDSDRFLIYLALWGILSVTGILGICIALNVRLAKKLMYSIGQLQHAAENITAGNLDFEVMSCEEKELDDLCHAFDDVRKKLKANAMQRVEMEDERSMLMANLSHDMRTPITSIKGYVEGIKDGIASTPEKMDKYLDTIYNKAIILERLVGNMSEYSELELGRMQYAFEFMDISSYLRELCRGYKTEITEGGLTFSTDICEEELSIVGDKTKLKRVFDNVISNAVKYNRPQGSIHVRLSHENAGALCCVTDTGKGIKEEDVKKAFDRFFRGDAARSNIKGNGLGLGISKQIVENHKGKIWIKSEEGVGTEVFIYFPIRERD